MGNATGNRVTSGNDAVKEEGTAMGSKGTGSKAGAVVDELRDSVGAHEAPDQVVESVRRHPARWASVGTAVVAAATAIGMLRWRRSRRTPQARAARIWRSVAGRFSR
jgi:hypothetical protein